MAGFAQRYPNRYNSPVDERLTSIHINQSDDPWWVTAILSWIGAYSDIMMSEWKEAEGYRATLEYKLKRESPTFLYKFHKMFCVFLKAAHN